MLNMMLHGGRVLAERLQSLLDAAGYGGHGGQKRFRAYLASRYGLSVSQTTISYWLSGARSPRLANMVAILDALGVHGQQREDLMRLAAGVPVPDAANRPDGEEAA